MKTRRLNIVIRVACLCAMILTCSGCGFIFGSHGGHEDLVGSDPKGGQICFFQFHDTSYLNKIIVKERWSIPSECNPPKYATILGNKYIIPLYPKNMEGQPIFGETADGSIPHVGFMYGDFYKLDDLVDSKKFIALKEEYYICYPFTCLERGGYYVDAEWKDLYNIDLDAVEILHDPYKIRYVISERTLANLTKKSTKHFQRENAEMITIDDIVNTLNMLIETNRIKEYCHLMYDN